MNWASGDAPLAAAIGDANRRPSSSAGRRRAASPLRSRPRFQARFRLKLALRVVTRAAITSCRQLGAQRSLDRY